MGDGYEETVSALEVAFKGDSTPGLPRPIVAPYGEGVAVLFPQGWEPGKTAELADNKSPCGVGREKPVMEVASSLMEAELAALGSGLLYGSALTRYADLGADRLLLLLYRDQPAELRAFVEETLGPS